VVFEMANMFLAITVLMFCISFALYLGTPNHQSSMLFSLLSGSGNLKSQFFVLISIGIFATVAVGLFGFPNQYLIFAGLTVLLLGFATLPTDILVDTSIPTEIKLFFGGVYTLIYILSLLTWYKGQID
jgi:hypothetical protein